MTTELTSAKWDDPNESKGSQTAEQAAADVGDNSHGTLPYHEYTNTDTPVARTVVPGAEGARTDDN